MNIRFEEKTWEDRIVGVVLWPIGLAVLFLLQQSVFLDMAESFRDEQGGGLIADRPWVHLLVCLAAAALAWLWARRQAHRAFRPAGGTPRLWTAACAAVSLLAAAMLAWLVLGLQMQPNSDQASVYNAAVALCAGDLTPLQQGAYMYRFSCQNFLLLADMLAVRLFGAAAPVALQLCNVVFLLAGAVLLGAASAELLGPDGPAAPTVTALTMLFLPLGLFVTYVYGTVPGFALSAGQIFCLLRWQRGGRWPWGLGCAACGVLAALCKQNYLIFTVAVCLYLAWDALCRRRWQSLAVALAAAALYAGAQPALNWALYTRNDLPQPPGLPVSVWVSVGLQDGGRPGWFEQGQLDFWRVYDEQGRAALEQQCAETIHTRIREFTADPAGALNFFARKNAAQWNAGTYMSLESNSNRTLRPDTVFWADALLSVRGRLYRPFITVFNIVLTQVWAGALLYLILCRRTLRLPQLLPYAVFFGGFLFHTVWEARAMSVLVYVVLLVPCAAAGYRALGRCLAGIGAGVQPAARRGTALLCGCAAAVLLASGVTGRYGSATAAGARAGRTAYEDWYRAMQTSALPDGAYYLRLRDDGSFLWVDRLQPGAHAVLGDALPVSLSSLYGRLLLDDPDRLQCYQLYTQNPADGSVVGLGVSSFGGGYYLTEKDLLQPWNAAQQLYLEDVQGGWRIVNRLEDEKAETLYLTAGPDGAVCLAPAGDSAQQVWEIIPAE